MKWWSERGLLLPEVDQQYLGFLQIQKQMITLPKEKSHFLYIVAVIIFSDESM